MTPECIPQRLDSRCIAEIAEWGTRATQEAQIRKDDLSGLTLLHEGRELPAGISITFRTGGW
jgi:hypothetical protein